MRQYQCLVIDSGCCTHREGNRRAFSLPGEAMREYTFKGFPAPLQQTLKAKYHGTLKRHTPQ